MAIYRITTSDYDVLQDWKVITLANARKIACKYAKAHPMKYVYIHADNHTEEAIWYNNKGYNIYTFEGNRRRVSPNTGKLLDYNKFVKYPPVPWE